MDLDKSRGRTNYELEQDKSLWQTGVESVMKSWSMTKIIRLTIFIYLIQITTYLFEKHRIFLSFIRQVTELILGIRNKKRATVLYQFVTLVW